MKDFVRYAITQHLGRIWISVGSRDGVNATVALCTELPLARGPSFGTAHSNITKVASPALAWHDVAARLAGAAG